MTDDPGTTAPDRLDDEARERHCEVCEDTGYVLCWSPGGPCPPEQKVCELCGPCRSCNRADLVRAERERTRRECMEELQAAESWEEVFALTKEWSHPPEIAGVPAAVLAAADQARAQEAAARQAAERERDATEEERDAVGVLEAAAWRNAQQECARQLRQVLGEPPSWALVDAMSLVNEWTEQDGDTDR